MEVQANIQIVDLMRRRETELQRVWECERAIRGTLGGGDFPFPLPPELPSRQAARPGRGRDSSASVSLPMVRRLKTENEDAYRVHLVTSRGDYTTLTDDPEVVRSAFCLPDTCLKIRSVETISFAADDSLVVTAVLYREEDPAAADRTMGSGVN